MEQAQQKASTDETTTTRNQTQVHRRWMEGLADVDYTSTLSKYPGMTFGNPKRSWNWN